jgi:hypothetical protein
MLQSINSYDKPCFTLNFCSVQISFTSCCGLALFLYNYLYFYISTVWCTWDFVLFSPLTLFNSVPRFCFTLFYYAAEECQDFVLFSPPICCVLRLYIILSCYTVLQCVQVRKYSFSHMSK